MLKNALVTHKSFGAGKVTDISDQYITICFEDAIKKFIYPDAFKSFLTIQNEALQRKINDDLGKKEIQEQEKKKQTKEQPNLNDEKIFPRAKAPKKQMRANIAFKCNYCDGGLTENGIGFKGVCSDDIIYNNVYIEKRTWCSSEGCPCLQYISGSINRFELEEYMQGDVESGYVCYESQMLRNWRAFAGIVQTGERKGMPMKLNQVQRNSLAVLTTRIPNTDEQSRFIFAVFMVDESYEGDEHDEGYVGTKSKYKISLSLEEAQQLFFWNYHANQNQVSVPAWNSGLHRYFDDIQAVQILKDIVSVKKGSADEQICKEFLEYFCTVNNVELNDVPLPNGALKRSGQDAKRWS